MDRSRVSDFSIERILSKQQVMDFPPNQYLPEIPSGFSLESENLRPPAPVPVPLPVPVPVPVLGCLQYRGMSYGDAFYSFGTAFHHTEFSGVNPNCGVYKNISHAAADAQPGHQAAGVSVQSRQKARMRTVFTDSQIKQLEALFELTDYPAIEARAELARNAGLHEETVRVWFKNRRARRKRQRSSSRVKSPRPSSPSPAAEKKLFTSFL